MALAGFAVPVRLSCHRCPDPWRRTPPEGPPRDLGRGPSPPPTCCATLDPSAAALAALCGAGRAGVRAGQRAAQPTEECSSRCHGADPPLQAPSGPPEAVPRAQGTSATATARDASLARRGGAHLVRGLRPRHHAARGPGPGLPRPPPDERGRPPRQHRAHAAVRHRAPAPGAGCPPPPRALSERLLPAEHPRHTANLQSRGPRPGGKNNNRSGGTGGTAQPFTVGAVSPPCLPLLTPSGEVTPRHRLPKRTPKLLFHGCGSRGCGTGGGRGGQGASAFKSLRKSLREARKQRGAEAEALQVVGVVSKHTLSGALWHFASVYCDKRLEAISGPRGPGGGPRGCCGSWVPGPAPSPAPFRRPPPEGR